MSYIPKKLKIYIKAQTQVHRTICGQKQMVFVHKAFATDLDKPSTHETAKNWAGYGRYSWDPDTRERTYTKSEYTTVEKDNEPFEGLKVYDIDIRSEGGRAYKVQTREGWAFDCREDCILDTIIEDGISKGGLMRGWFIWAKAGSQMKITRVGSALYQECHRDMNKIEKSKIKNKDLEYGGIYESLSGGKGIYLGRDKGCLNFVWAWGSTPGDFAIYWKTAQRKYYKEYLEDLKNPQRNRYRTRRDPRLYQLNKKKSHVYREKIGQLTKEEVEELIIIRDEDK